ncbi:MAG: hypothetical protein ACUVRM_09350 [Bacillota bacterium]
MNLLSYAKARANKDVCPAHLRDKLGKHPLDRIIGACPQKLPSPRQGNPADEIGREDGDYQSAQTESEPYRQKVRMQKPFQVFGKPKAESGLAEKSQSCKMDQRA